MTDPFENMVTERVNGTIEKAFLGFEDHGILTISLRLVLSGGTYQHFGGYMLFHYKGWQEGQAAGNYAGFWIQRVLDTVGVTSWDQLVGQHVRVGRDKNRIIRTLGNIVDDKWFAPQIEIDEFLEKAGLDG